MIPEGYEEGRIAMRIARLLPVIAVAISLLANRNNAGWTTLPGLRTPNLQKENWRCRVRRDTPQAVFGWADRFRQSANAVGDQSAAIGRDAAKLGNVALSRLADEIEPRPPFALAVANGVSVSSAPSADARTKTADLKAIRTDPKPGIVTAREHAHACAVHPSDGSPCSAPTLRNVPTTRH
jgi:hypothetical protein